MVALSNYHCCQFSCQTQPLPYLAGRGGAAAGTRPPGPRVAMYLHKASVRSETQNETNAIIHFAISAKMSNTILKGFYSNNASQLHQGEEDSLLLKNFLAGGDSGKRERREHSNSLFPAHISAAIDTNEWLAENKNKASSVAAAISGKENIMAPVLKSTSAEYWLDRQNRPPVNERGMYHTTSVDQPFLHEGHSSYQLKPVDSIVK